MSSLITRRRATRLSGFASTQVAVQAIGFGAGIVLVRAMEQVQYGYYTLALSMVGIANILGDLGLATAVLAIGGRLTGQPHALRPLVADADTLHCRLAWVAVGILAPCFAVLLLRQHAPTWQVAALTVFIVLTSALTVRNGVALSIARLQGQVGLQQKLDMAVNAGRLCLLLLLASWVTLDAAVASMVNLLAALAGFWVLRRRVVGRLGVSAQPAGAHTAALRHHLGRQAPNAVYYVISGQLAVWLIGLFGNAERVAEVGALGRLGAVFAVLGAVTAALVLPYFAKQHEPAAIASGFACVNAFYAALLTLLVALAAAFPATILWVLGGPYGSLHAELVWMVVAATLAAWGGTVYSIGCARGWVMPAGLTVTSGVLTTLAAASLVDVSSVRGCFIINATTALVGVLVAVGYFSRELRRHTRLSTATP